MSEFRMPALGADMEAGTLVEWLKKPGDRVKSGDIIAVVETQKGAIEVEVFQDGVLSDIRVPEGERAPVGTVLALIDSGAAPAAIAPTPAVAARPATPVERQPTLARASVAVSSTRRVKITPAAKRRAQSLSIDIETITRRTGVEGAVCLADVEAPAPVPTARRTRTGVDLPEMRKAIASAMSRSKREIPHYYLTETVDLHAAMTWLAHNNADREPIARLLPAVLFLKAAALSLQDWPQLNGAYENGAFAPAENINVGWAIALRGGGLIAPAIRDTNKKSLEELMIMMRDLVERARHGNLRSSELASPTLTVTSVGDRGAETAIGVIYPPQVALVGFGRIVTRPTAVGDRVACRAGVTVSLAGDHRVTDGHIGGLYLAQISRLLQEPEKL